MLLNRNRSELHFSSSYERLICSEELGNRHQTPTLIGCIFLTNPQKASALRLPLLANPAAISEASIMTDFLQPYPAVFAAFVCDPRLERVSLSSTAEP